MSTGVSLLMNGVCCVYTMNEEKDLREAMRQDIRDEWRLQREIETKERQQREAESEWLRLQALEKRYHKLMALSTNHTEPMNESRIYNSREILGTSPLPSRPYQAHCQWDTKETRKRACPPLSLFDEELDDAEMNPQEGIM